MPFNPERKWVFRKFDRLDQSIRSKSGRNKAFAWRFYSLMMETIHRYLVALNKFVEQGSLFDGNIMREKRAREVFAAGIFVVTMFDGARHFAPYVLIE